MKMTEVPRISAFVLGFFRHIARGYFRRHFTAVRLSRPEIFAAQSGVQTGPLILYANHSSWWDPMVSVLLAAQLMPGRRHFAPMDAASLSRYKILSRIGIFPIVMNTTRGAAQFLRTGLAILQSGGVLWITPQGRFVDTRVRPLVFKPGLAALATRVPGGCTVLPLAIEYPFWDERLPETLLHFGDPVYIHGQSSEAVETLLNAALLRTMDELQLLATARDRSLFHTLRRGRAGAGGFYALGKRLMALLRRQPYRPEHTLTPEPQPTHGMQQ